MVKHYNGETYIIPKAFEDEIRADERAKILGLVNWKSEQNYRTRVVDIRIEHPEMLNTEQVIKIIAEQLKEQK